MSKLIGSRSSVRPVIVLIAAIFLFAGTAVLPLIFAKADAQTSEFDSVANSTLTTTLAETPKSSTQSGRTSDRTLYVYAANGHAFSFDENINGPTFAKIKTSLPVFKAFGLSSDGRNLLYSPLNSGRPSGLLYLENLVTGKRTKVTSRLVLSASLSPTNSSLVAYTFADRDGFGLGLTDLSTKADRILVERDVYSEVIQWDDDGGGIRYFNTTPAEDSLELDSPSDVSNPFSSYSEWREQDKGPSLVRPVKRSEQLSLSPQFVSIDAQISGSVSSDIPFGFPRMSGDQRVPLDFLPKPESESSESPSFPVVPGIFQRTAFTMSQAMTLSVSVNSWSRTRCPAKKWHSGQRSWQPFLIRESS